MGELTEHLGMDHEDPPQHRYQPVFPEKPKDSVSPEFEAWWLTHWHHESAAQVALGIPFKKVAWKAWQEAYRQGYALVANEPVRHRNV